MRRLLAGIAFASASLLSAAHAQDCKLVEIASLDAKPARDGRVLLPITLDDTPHLLFMDTGSEIGMLSTSVVDQLGLKLQRINNGMTFYRFSGDSMTHYVSISSLKIGPDEAKYTAFLVADWSNEDPASDGVLGTDILKNFDLDLDFAANKLNLFSQDHCDGKVVYWAREYAVLDADIDKTGGITVAMTLDGHDVKAIVDTGTALTTLNETDAKRDFGIDPTSPGMETLTDARGIKYYRYRFKSLSMGSVTMPNPLIFILPDAAGAAARRDVTEQKLQGYQGIGAYRGPAIILGTDALRHLHLYVAYREHKIYVTAADAH